MTTQQVAGSERSEGWRRPVLIGLAVLVVLIAVSVLTHDDADVDTPFDPRNPTRSGAQAVAKVLDQHGVDVHIARGQAALLDQEIDSGTTVVVTNPSELGGSTLDRLREHARSAGALVVVGEGEVLGSLFDLETGADLSGPRPADCDLELADGLVVRSYGGPGLDADGCFGTAGSAVLVHRDDVWLMTSPRAITNQHVLEADNGALALRLLGQHPRLVWYVADAADTPASDGVALSALLPSYLVPALWLLVLSVVALVLWRGRRLGPLVTEPLPVVVRAAESTRSRGQIYHRTRDRQHAAAVLVEASRRRLTEVLRLPRGTSLEGLVLAVAARTRRDPRAVHEMLAVPLVGKDSQLVELGQRLTQLENEVRAP
jgi:uncharacterized protein DUF4350